MSSKTKKAKKPKNKFKLTVHFDTELGLKNFMSTYINSCEQHTEYYSECWGDDWIYVKPDRNACPKCEFNDWGDYYDYDKTPNKQLAVHCNNCDHDYKIRNPDPDVKR